MAIVARAHQCYYRAGYDTYRRGCHRWYRLAVNRKCCMKEVDFYRRMGLLLMRFEYAEYVPELAMGPEMFSQLLQRVTTVFLWSCWPPFWQGAPTFWAGRHAQFRFRFRSLVEIGPKELHWQKRSWNPIEIAYFLLDLN